jgi:hypothetical protein
MWSYDHARDFATTAVRAEAVAQERGRADEVGAAFDEFDRNLPRDSGPEFDKLHVALRFWDEWRYARDHDWRTPVPARRDEWPQLARCIADALESDEDITDPAVLFRFEAR